VDLALSVEDGSSINSPAQPEIAAWTANVVDELLGLAAPGNLTPAAPGNLTPAAPANSSVTEEPGAAASSDPVPNPRSHPNFGV
jgi:hypothetical protein